MRLFSAVCSTELIVVAARDEADITIGGAEPLTALRDGEPAAGPAAGFDTGSQIGKRYVDADTGVEVLCTKPGVGVPAVAGTVMAIKDAQPLPASD
jgi:hypothetical protein